MYKRRFLNLFVVILLAVMLTVPLAVPSASALRASAADSSQRDALSGYIDSDADINAEFQKIALGDNNLDIEKLNNYFNASGTEDGETAAANDLGNGEEYIEVYHHDGTMSMEPVNDTEEEQRPRGRMAVVPESPDAPDPYSFEKKRLSGSSAEGANPDAGRLVITIMGDGYTAEQQGDVCLHPGYLGTCSASNKCANYGTFFHTAQAVTNNFLTRYPYSAFANYINVYAIGVISEESGATDHSLCPRVNGDYACGVRNAATGIYSGASCLAKQPGDTHYRNTYFGAQWYWHNTAGFITLAVPYYGSSADIQDVNGINNYYTPTSVSGVVLVNSRNPESNYDWWSNGTSSGSNSTNGAGPERRPGATYGNVDTDQASTTVKHEMGHAVGKLGDEYSSGNYFEYANKTSSSIARDAIKWRGLYGIDGIDIKPISGQNNYRPTDTCGMNASGNSFCLVCRIQLTKKMAAVISEPFRAGSSDSGSATTWDTSTEYLTVPGGAEKIRNYAFAGLTALKTVNLPSSIKSIGTYAFLKNTALQSIYLYSAVPPAFINEGSPTAAGRDNTFKDVDRSEIILYVPAGTRTAYLNSAWGTGWNDVIEMSGSSYTVTDIEITPVTSGVIKGGTRQYTAVVSGTNNPPQSVIWTVTGNHDINTIITDRGLLSVSPNEAASFVRVRAASSVNPTVYEEIEIPLTADIEISRSGTLYGAGSIYTFPSVSHGYATQSEVAFTVTNKTSFSTGTLSLSVSNSNFDADRTSMSSISVVNGTRSFYIRPASGLAVGTHTAVVTVYNNDNFISESFNVCFTVTAAPTVLSITVTAESEFFSPGGTLQFFSAVNGENDPANNVIWQINSQTHSNTRIYMDGFLFVSPDETSTEITVRALPLSSKWAGVYGEKTVYLEGGEPPQTWGLTNSISGTHTFADVTAGYEPIDARTVTVTNSGNRPAEALNITIDGANADDFVLSATSLADIPAGGNANFTVCPAAGLAAGTYTAEVTVSSPETVDEDPDDGIVPPPQVSTSFNVSFTVIAPIESAALLITAPVTGALPNSIADGEGNFTIGDISWSHGSGNFAGGTQYTAVVTLTAEVGYIFPENFTATVNGGTAEIINNNGMLAVISYQFPMTDSVPITAAEIGIAVPKTADEVGSAATGIGNFVINDISWSPDDSVFAPSSQYTVTVTLTADSGYTFNGIASVTVNGEAADIISNTGTVLTLSYQFPQTSALESITSAAVTVTQPIIGAAPDTAANAAGNFSVGSVVWSHGTGNFAASGTYTAAVTLTANSGYTFEGLTLDNATINDYVVTDLTIAADGSTATLAYAFVTASYIDTAAVTVTAPVTGEVRDLTATVAEGENFQAGTVTWSPDDVTFEGNVRYTATVVLTAKKGYVFNDLGTFTINGHAASVTENTGKTITLSYRFDETDLYSFSLEPYAAYIFPEVMVNYETVAEHSISVINTGNRVTDVNIGMTGTNPDAFILSVNTVDNIAVGGNVSFSVRPKDGLAPGWYLASVSVSSINDVKNIGVQFLVEEFITEASVNITIPVMGASRTSSSATAVTVPSEQNFRAPLPLTWSGTGDNFVAGEAYTASFILQSYYGYRFDELETLTVNGFNADFSFVDDSIIRVTYTFPVLLYTLTLDGGLSDTHDFGSVFYGENVPPAYAINIKNTSAAAIPQNTVTFALGGADAFTLSGNTVTALISAGGSNASVTVRPKTGLAVGEYTAVVTVGGVNIQPVELTVHFKVNAVELAGIAIKTPPKLNYTHGGTLDLSQAVITLVYNNSATEDVIFSGFTARNITASIAHGTELDYTDHNGTQIIFRAGEFTAMTAGLAVNQKPIDTADIIVTAPMTGDTPDDTVTGGGLFTVLPAVWKTGDTVFEGDTRYTVTVTLFADADFIFTGGTTATINGNAATVTNITGSTITLSYQFEETASAALAGMVIKTQPKLNYTHGDVLDLSGTVITLTYSDATMEDVAYAQFATRSIIAAPVHGAVLDHTSNDGNRITFGLGDFTAETGLLVIAKKVIQTAAAVITAPVTGETPSIYAESADNFTVSTVTWSPADGVFRGNTRYTAEVLLTAMGDFTFGGITEITVNGFRADINNNTGDTVTVSYEFAATMPQSLVGIVIKTAPGLIYTHGDLLDLSAAVITLSYNDETLEDVVFADFETKDISSSMANGTAIVYSSHNGAQITFSTGGFTATTGGITVNKKVIGTVSVKITEPKTGSTPDTAAIGAAGFNVSTVVWTPEQQPFRGKTVYKAAVTLTAADGFTFTGMTSAVVNGHSASFTDNSGDTVIVSYEFAETATAVLQEMNLKTQPKLNYSHGDAVDLSAAVITFTYNDLTAEDIDFEDFTIYGITANIAHNTVLNRTDNNGNNIVFSAGSVTVKSSALVINKIDQAAVAINSPGTITYGDEDFSLTVSGGSIDSEVIFTVTEGTSVEITEEGKFTVLSAGGVIIEAVKAGDNNYNPVSTMIVITVDKAEPEIPFIPNITMDEFAGGMVLRDIELPDGWEWWDASIAVSEGENRYTAVYLADVNSNYKNSAAVIEFTVGAERQSITGFIIFCVIGGSVVAIMVISGISWAVNSRKKAGKMPRKVIRCE